MGNYNDIFVEAPLFYHTTYVLTDKQVLLQQK